MPIKPNIMSWSQRKEVHIWRNNYATVTYYIILIKVRGIYFVLLGTVQYVSIMYVSYTYT